MPSIKICLISSHGGHLRELLNVAEGLIGNKYYVTHLALHTEEILKGEKHYFISDPHLSWWKYLLNGIQSLKHLFRESPDVILSTGAGIAIPSILLGKYLLKAKIIFIESGANVRTPSKTGKFLYKHCDLFFVQWKSLLDHYPKAKFAGFVA